MELQEKIDLYLSDQLNPADKLKFEELISSDNLIKNEVALQHSITNVINQTGSMQLKARLNSIPVSMSSTGNNMMLRWLGAGVAASLLGGLIIFLLPTQQAIKTSDTVSSATSVSSGVSQQAPAAQASVEQYTNTTAQTNTSTTVKKSDKIPTSNVSKSNAELENYEAASDYSEVGNTDIAQAHQSVSIPSSNLSSENNKLNSLTVTVESANLSEKSYQFTGTKLTLFGDFAKHPYELLELNHKGQTALFLSYQNDYYELVWGKSTKSPLNKVTNKKTIEKLKLINH